MLPFKLASFLIAGSIKSMAGNISNKLGEAEHILLSLDKRNEYHHGNTYHAHNLCQRCTKTLNNLALNGQTLKHSVDVRKSFLLRTCSVVNLNQSLGLINFRQKRNHDAKSLLVRRLQFFHSRADGFKNKNKEGSDHQKLQPSAASCAKEAGTASR